MVRCGLKNEYQVGIMCLRELFMINYFKFKSQHNWGNFYDHLMSTRIFTVIMNKMFI